MSLQTDSTFIAALTTDAAALGISGRVYGTAIPLPDAELLNAPLPYAVVTFDGMENSDFTKDDLRESAEDIVTVSVELAAATLSALHGLTACARVSIRNYLATGTTDVLDYQLSAGPIQFDAGKPCYWQALHYRCVTNALNQF